MGSTTNIVIRLADLDEIIDLRWRILRAELERETAIFDGDREPTTRHVAAVRDEQVVGCATIVRRPWQGKLAWQLRGMAVAADLRGSGIGRLLLETLERIVREEEHSQQLWCNARTPATPFYRKLGWEIVGEEFVIATAGPHYKMSKTLSGG